MYEPAVLHEPTGGAFDDRSALDHAEPFDLRVFGDDLDSTPSAAPCSTAWALNPASTHALVRVGCHPP
jgi:hypothetical protein